MSAEAATEQMTFQAEVNQLLKLMIHSLYSNQEIFLRELISNGSDACDKLRFEALENKDLYEDDTDLRIIVSYDEEAGTITVEDNGIGMNRDEVVANIGTIARSGTRQFLESLTGDQKADARLIGQFGVGFYASFVVAERVRLTTRRAGEATDSGVLWESDGTGGYTLGKVEKPGRGTEITLFIKEDCKEFLNNWRLRGIVKKYSDHITFPIMMWTEPAPVAGENEEDAAPAEPELERINSASALWTRAKNEISDEDYQSFYKQVCNDYDDALAWTHNRVEGKHEYTSLLYIPKRAPFDLYESVDRRAGIKLFVQRVFIMDEAEKLMPRYLRFVRGLVDSSDLPLNVSREILQNNRIIDSIRNASVKKIVSLLETIASDKPDEYKAFWTEFGRCLKEAPIEDSENREQVAGLYRFDTTAGSASGDWVSLADYIGRMQPGQDKIYYITADSYQAAGSSPHLEVFRKRNIEVLLLHDQVDEWTMQYLTEYDGKQFQSVARGEIDLAGVGKEPAEDEPVDTEKSESLVKRMKEILEKRASDVRVSNRLTTSPACVVLGDYDMGLHMQQLMKQAGRELPESKPVLEINPSHPIITLLDQEPDDDRFRDWSELLLDQALLADGGQLDDGAGFVKRMNDMMLALHQQTTSD